jgi:PIN domain nuclease of toxin-antitoxin system
MKVLIDTHYLIWLATEPGQITSAEHALFDRVSGNLYVSPVSIWEVRLKWQAIDRDGRRKGVLAPDAAMQFSELAGLALVPLTGADCAETLDPVTPHKDPFDEMLLIHASQLGARFLTRDRILRRHPLALTA